MSIEPLDACVDSNKVQVPVSECDNATRHRVRAKDFQLPKRMARVLRCTRWLPTFICCGERLEVFRLGSRCSVLHTKVERFLGLFLGRTEQEIPCIEKLL